jgi:ABC-type nitrate/sulfonate/bicarbonate transport system permease component
MLAAANQFEPARVIAYMVLVGLVGLSLNALFLMACRRSWWRSAGGAAHG